MGDDHCLAFARLGGLHDRLHARIRHIVAREGPHKSYEGALELSLPPAFGGKARATLHCYVLGPSRHYEWTADSVAELVEQMARDIDAWIREDEAMEREESDHG